MNFVLIITNKNAIEQDIPLIGLNLHAHGMNDVLAFSGDYKLMEFYTLETSLCVNIIPTDNVAYFINGAIPINSL